MCFGLHRYSTSTAQRATAESSDGHNSAAASTTHFGCSSSSSGGSGGSGNDSSASAAGGGGKGLQLGAGGAAGRRALKVKDYPASSDFKQELPDHMQVCVCVISWCASMHSRIAQKTGVCVCLSTGRL